MDLNSLLHSPNAANIQVVISAKDLRDCFESWMKFATEKIRERDEPSYYTREDLEKVLHVTQPTILSWRKKGLLPEPVTIEGRVLYNKADVSKAIEDRKIKIRTSKK